MKIVIISSPDTIENETKDVVRMFEMGLQYFHIRKPKFSKKQMVEYINSIPSEYHRRLILHSYHQLTFKYKLGGIHLSRSHMKRGKTYNLIQWFKRRMHPSLIITRTFHKLTDINSDLQRYSYCFLSPVFDSISYSTLSAGFSRRTLLVVIPQSRQPILAMGGVSIENIRKVAELGFHGAALLGSIWEPGRPPYEKYGEILKISEAIALQRLES
jgi:thiamine-phosphate pyrophosphorylase